MKSKNFFMFFIDCYQFFLYTECVSCKLILCGYLGKNLLSGVLYKSKI